MLASEATSPQATNAPTARAPRGLPSAPRAQAHRLSLSRPAERLWDIALTPAQLEMQQLWREPAGRRQRRVPTLQPPPFPGALQTCLPGPAAAAKTGDCVPRNLAAAHPMLSSHSRQISLYLPAEWASGASSEDDCARCREPAVPAMPRPGRTMALCNGFRGSCKPGEAEQVWLTG